MWCISPRITRLNASVRVYARFVLKTDDDTFVNMFSLMSRLHELAGSKTSQFRVLLMCNVWRIDRVPRAGKWRIARSTFRRDHWPTFCQGTAFIMTWNFVTSAYQLVHRVPRLWLDDVTHSHCFRKKEICRLLKSKAETYAGRGLGFLHRSIHATNAPVFPVYWYLYHGADRQTDERTDVKALFAQLDDQCDKIAVDHLRYCQRSWPTTVQFISVWASTFVELSW